MLDIGWPELLLVAVITVLVVGPKELPRVLRTVTFWVRKAQGLARDFQLGMNDLARQADLDDIKKDMDTAVKENTDSLKVENFDSELDPDNSISGMFTGKAIRTPTAGQTAKAADEEIVSSETPTADESMNAPPISGAVAPNNNTAELTTSGATEISRVDTATHEESDIDLDTKTRKSTGSSESAGESELNPQPKPRPITTEDIPIDLDPLPEIADQR